MVLPSGTVTFLFSDVEGSTQLLERFPHAMGAALARHHELFEEIVAANHGAIFETVGDAVYAAFARAPDATNAALRIQLALAAEDWGEVERIACRLAIHTGEVEQRGEHYFGPPLFRCARLQTLGYGEQTLLSGLTADLVRNHLPDRASLQDLGIHTLKDLGEPEHVFALVHPDLRQTFPPPKSVDSHPNNLPLQLSSFVGREQELEQLEALVRAHRLTTITGTGGMGKTRLALQLAAQVLGDDPNAAFFVDLAAVRDADQIVPTVAGTIGLTAAAGSTLEAAIAGYLGTLKALLVLDNTEQIGGAGAPILALLERTPPLRALVTGRRPLHVRGERVFPLEVLSIDAGPADIAPAVRLFAERAAEVLPDFELTHDNHAAVTAICERLDGLPLAIELAAARVTVFEPMALLSRLDQRFALLTGGAEDRPERHQTLRATIDWSYQLLPPADQVAFSRLAVFSGGWSVEAAEAVTGADPDTIARLIQASLLYRRRDRFGMLDTVHEFAAERNAERPDLAQTVIRHAHWFAGWVAGLLSREHDHNGIRSAEGIEALVGERENVDLAVRTLLDAHEDRKALDLCMALWYFWMSHGEARRGMEWMRQALELALPEDSPEAAWPLALLGELAMWCGDTEEAISLKERCIVLAGEATTDGRRTTAAVYHDLAYLWAQTGRFDKAERAAARAMDLRRSDGHPRGIAHALSAAGWVRQAHGDLNKAHELFEEGVHHARLDGDPMGVAYAVASVADIERRLGLNARSAKSWCEVIAAVEARDSTDLDADALLGVGELLANTGHADRAAVVLGAASAVRRRNGMEERAIEFNEAYDRVRSVLPPAKFKAAWARGEAMSRDQAMRIAADEAAETAKTAT